MNDPWADVREIEPFDDGDVPVPIGRLNQLLKDNRVLLAPTKEITIEDLRQIARSYSYAINRTASSHEDHKRAAAFHRFVSALAALPEHLLKPAPNKRGRER